MNISKNANQIYILLANQTDTRRMEVSIDDAKEFAINLYRTHFWNNVGLNLLTNKSLSCKVFSLGVLLNPKKAVKLLQQACNDIGAILSIDGIIGTNSATWINSYKYPQAIEESFESLATAELKKKGKSKYIAGWLIRVDESAIG